MGAGLTNGIAAIVVGLFIGAAYFAGNGQALAQVVKDDRGFFVWFLALVVFLSVKDLLPARIGDVVLVMVLIGFLIRGGDKLFPAINKFLGSA